MVRQGATFSLLMTVKDSGGNKCGSILIHSYNSYENHLCFFLRDDLVYPNVEFEIQDCSSDLDYLCYNKPPEVKTFPSNKYTYILILI